MFSSAHGLHAGDFISPAYARRVAWMSAAAALAAIPLAAGAQTADSYPSRVVRMIVPFAPGGAPDIIARHLSTRLTDMLGQSFVVENRAGANGNIGVEAVIKAAPDGYMLLVGNVSTNAINEGLYADIVPIRPSRDLAGITELVEIPHILAVTPSFPVKSLADLIALAKKSPGKINYASAGTGGYPHLDMLRLQKAAGIQMTHISYKGAAPIMQALMTGEVQVTFLNLATGLEQVKAGKIRAIAAVPATRIAELPGLPTMAEQGYAGIGTNAWQGMFAPIAIPAPIVDRIFKAVVAVLSKTEMKEMLAKQMMNVALSKSPQEFTDFVRAETQKWALVVRENNVKIE
jgi:tripartite-type tricarboxylate transporter receptor subunit TctC